MPLPEPMPDLRQVVRGGNPSSWERLVAMTRSHRLHPVLAWYVRRHGLSVPPDVASVLAGAVYESAARSAGALEQLRALGGEVAFPMVLVKGPAVAAAYPEPWMRPYNDLDFLVPEEAVAQAEKTMRRLGYRARVTGIRSSHLPPFYPPGPGLRMEIHTSLSRREGRDFLTFAQVEKFVVPFRDAPGLSTLSPAPHFLYLCEHDVGRHVLTNGLLSLFDVHFFTAGWRDEWDEVRELAGAWGLERHVGLMLTLESSLWRDGVETMGFPVPPDDVLEAAMRAVVGALPRAPSVWRDMPGKGIGGWLAYLGTVLSGGPEIRRLPLQARVRFYVSRPWHLARAHGPTLLGILFGSRGTRESLRTQRLLTEWVRKA